MKKALIVGIDNYLNISDLTGCVNDAHDVALNFKKNSHSRLSPAVFYSFESSRKSGNMLKNGGGQKN